MSSQGNTAGWSLCAGMRGDDDDKGSSLTEGKPLDYRRNEGGARGWRVTMMMMTHYLFGPKIVG